MKRIVKFIFLFLLIGCIKTTTKEIIPPDQQIEGNRGYIYGNPPPITKVKPKPKKIIAVEVEIPPLPKVSPRAISPDKEIWGNQGYIYRAYPTKPYIYIEKEKPQSQPSKLELPPKIITKPSEVKKETPQPKMEYIIYKVKEGESLWKIAKKFYGDPNKWTIIYEENKSLIEDPSYIKPGLELRIPLLEKKKGKYIK